MLPDVLRGVFGEAAVGIFDSGARSCPCFAIPTTVRKRRLKTNDPVFRSKPVACHNLRRQKRPRESKKRASAVVDASSDSDDSTPTSSWLVSDILVECRLGDSTQRAFLTQFEADAPGLFYWVRESGLNRTTATWWSLERERRYPGFTATDFCSVTGITIGGNFQASLPKSM